MKGQLINPSGLDAPNLAPLAMEPDIIQIQSARLAIIGFGPFILLESLLEILVNGWSVRTESAFLHRREYPLNEIMLAFYKIRVILEEVLMITSSVIGSLIPEETNQIDRLPNGNRNLFPHVLFRTHPFLSFKQLPKHIHFDFIYISRD